MVGFEQPCLKNGHDAFVVQEESDGVARTNVQCPPSRRQRTHVIIAEEPCSSARHERAFNAVMLVRYTGSLHALVHKLQVCEMSSRNVLEQVLTIVRYQLTHHDITGITGRDVHTFLVGRHLSAQIFRLEPRSNNEITFFVDLVGFAVICERGRLSCIRHRDGFRQVVQNIGSDCCLLYTSDAADE